MLKIGWFSTGRGEGSQGLLRFVQEKILGGQLDARIEFVFSNREAGEAEGSDQYFKLVRSYELPLTTFSSTNFRREKGGRFADHRDEYDQRVMALLSHFSTNICVLAGYMLIASGEMCRTYPLLNLHPALPDGPIGTWQEVIWELIKTKARNTGAMVHLATEDVDRGPVASYCTVPITGKSFAPLWERLNHSTATEELSTIKEEQGENFPLFQVIRRAEFQSEPYLLLETLRVVANGAVVPRGGNLFDHDGQPLSQSHPSGLCLDREVSLAMRADGLIPAS